ncbi:Asp23/Gls24 family envelope stress response protein [Streptomyces sp. ISL-44]|uniref:Asp23/Gls24 family envelope stress response protein n=1 Tax=Streptomyces sp. ISL-44 TaxID=2819184 RepID=UPI001BEC7B37|nr:Asp23/Gls24 family envelope stress response protein [Streptomyces sp. ISL-44]MBT2543111.1 Asp23/Gls24 family envelope stress response protein [Streptomyces sp. ISL-44]
MTSTRNRDIHQTAARAALDVPGVSALQPGLADRLATVASRAQQAMGAASLLGEAGIRAEHTPEGGWHVEVRCVVHEDRRVLDIAQQVREHVRTAITAHLAQHGTTAPVTVLVTVTRTV